jgi:CHAT domain-containing protein
MADVYQVLNLYPEALESYARAIDVFERVHLDYERGKAELGRARVMLKSGQTDAAQRALSEAEGIFIRHKNGVQRAQVRLMRSLVLREAGDVIGAAEEADAAVRAFVRHRLHTWAAEARFAGLEIELAAGRDVTRRLHAVARTARRYAHGWQECRAMLAIGLYYAQQGKIARALRTLRAAVDALETVRTLVAPEDLHVAFLRDKLSVYESLIETLLARGRREDVVEAFQCVERAKSRLLLERVQSALERRLPGADADTGNLRARLATLRAELSRSYHRLHAVGGDDARRLSASAPVDLGKIVPLEESYRALLRELELKQQPDLLTLSTVVPESELRAALGPHEALIEYAVVRDRICAFVLTRDDLNFRRDLAAPAEIVELTRRLRYHLHKAGIHRDYVDRHEQQLLVGTQRVLGSLYQRLLAPLEDLLPPDVQRLVLVPHGSLHGLPFHAFFDGARFGLDRWEFVYAPSAAVWHSVRMRKRHHPAEPRFRALLMGVPEPGIERVREEVEHLARLLPQSDLYCGESATVETFRRLAGDYRLLHLATHALFRADNPLFSGLRFADGWLLARDLYELRLDCDLATLAACRTGVADVEAGDELFGLTRGFLAAGVRSLAVSLWPADDAATADLMSRFYAALVSGEPCAAALRAAQCALRAHYPHPYHWAAFVLVGEG